MAHCFGLRLKELRKELDLTQEGLAKKIDQTKANISKYELGKLEPSIDILVKFSTIFDCSVDYLVGKTNVRKWQSETLAFNTVAMDGLDEDEIEQIRGMIELLKRKHGK